MPWIGIFVSSVKDTKVDFVVCDPATNQIELKNIPEDLKIAADCFRVCRMLLFSCMAVCGVCVWGGGVLGKNYLKIRCY